MAKVRTSMPELRRQLEVQLRWIEGCGGSLAGYVERYGSKDDPQHSGSGGEAIYAADVNELNRIRLAIKRREARRG